MQDFLIIFLLGCCAALVYLYFIKENKIKTINKEIDEENKKLENAKQSIINKIDSLNKIKEKKIEDINEMNKITKDINTTAGAAFNQYQESLDSNYMTVESEYDQAVKKLEDSYNQIQDTLLYKIDQIQDDLNKVMQTRTAALQAQLKENEIKDKQSFYCPQVAEEDLKDAKILKDIEYKLNNPRILRMLIWQNYYQKPMNQVCANVLGGSTTIVIGIYKITNQLNGLCYIGQSKNIATRWKTHAKAGLGIDTPAGNKLYEAMQKDGLENFSFEVLEQCDAADLDEKEKFYISLYQADQFGYNSNSGINKS